MYSKYVLKILPSVHTCHLLSLLQERWFSWLHCCLLLWSLHYHLKAFVVMKGIVLWWLGFHFDSSQSYNRLEMVKRVKSYKQLLYIVCVIICKTLTDSRLNWMVTCTKLSLACVTQKCDVFIWLCLTVSSLEQNELRNTSKLIYFCFM